MPLTIPQTMPQTSSLRLRYVSPWPDPCRARAGHGTGPRQGQTNQPAEQESKHLSNIRQVTYGLPRAGEGYFSPDGKWLVCSAESGVIALFNFQEKLGQQRMEDAGHALLKSVVEGGVARPATAMRVVKRGDATKSGQETPTLHGSPPNMGWEA